MGKIFTGVGKQFQEVHSLALDEEGLDELSRRVKAQPHFLGEPMVVVGESADFPQTTGGASRDLVALDIMGRAVIVSFVSGTADVLADTHAIHFAAQVGELHPEELGKITRSFLNRTANESLRRAWEERGVEMNEETVELPSLLAAVFERDAEDYAELINGQQRIIIAAEGFSARLVNMIRWLNRSGVLITGLRFREFVVGGQEIFFAEQVVPTQDPAEDAHEEVTPVPTEVTEPWKVKGRAYHADHLSPAAAHLMDELILLTKVSTFSLHWTHKYYFWIRGERRNLRVRTYHRDRLEIGFYNASPEAVSEHLARHGLQEMEVYQIGGYTDSPFVSLTAEMRLDQHWSRMLNAWLGGEARNPER